MEIIKISEQFQMTADISELSKALLKFQEAFEKTSLKKDAKNGGLRNEYLSLDNLLNTVRPLLTKCGLILSQDLAGDYLATTLMHVSGQFKTTFMPFNPMDANRGVNTLQAIGGGITYAKRYAIGAVLCISVDTDNDGNTPPIKTKPNQKPVFDKSHPKWADAVTKIKAGEGSVEALKKAFTLSKDIEEFLNKVANA
jgi:hypothetical protein